MFAVIGPNIHANRAKETINVGVDVSLATVAAPNREGTGSLASFVPAAFISFLFNAIL